MAWVDEGLQIIKQGAPEITGALNDKDYETSWWSETPAQKRWLWQLIKTCLFAAFSTNAPTPIVIRFVIRLPFSTLFQGSRYTVWKSSAVEFCDAAPNPLWERYFLRVSWLFWICWEGQTESLSPPHRRFLCILTYQSVQHFPAPAYFLGSYKSLLFRQ